MAFRRSSSRPTCHRATEPLTCCSRITLLQQVSFLFESISVSLFVLKLSHYYINIPVLNSVHMLILTRGIEEIAVQRISNHRCFAERRQRTYCQSRVVSYTPTHSSTLLLYSAAGSPRVRDMLVYSMLNHLKTPLKKKTYSVYSIFISRFCCNL